LFKLHEDVCKHGYLTVFRPYKQTSSSEQQSNYCKNFQRSQLNNISDVKQPERLGVVVSEYDNFLPGVPDVSLCGKIINGFCAATQPSKFEEAGCSVWGTHLEN
jgi:hypothetical protein